MQQKAQNLIRRAKIISLIRKWFEENHFIEVETPILVDCPDLSPNFDILETKIIPATLSKNCHFEPTLGGEKSFKLVNCANKVEGISPPSGRRNGKKKFFLKKKDKMNVTKYLITSPEFSMKKLLSLQGLDNIFTITKVFRDNEENTGIHSIEFTMIEWYRKNTDYTKIMEDTENLVKLLFKKHTPLNSPLLRGNNIPLLYKEGLGEVFPKLKCSHLFQKYAKIDNVEKLKLPVFKKVVQRRGYSSDNDLTYEQCFNLIFLNEIEPSLPKTPFFLIDYPSPLAALAKLKKNNPYISERFELYINNIELCNGFSELTDGKEQLERFKNENKERKKMGKPVLPIDYELCEKLNSIGKAGGNALGIDRLVMTLLSAKTINEVMY